MSGHHNRLSGNALGVAKPSHNRSPSMMQSVSWQFKSRDEWKSFVPQANKIIDSAQSEGKSECKFMAFDTVYVVDLKKMECHIEGAKKNKKYPIRKAGGNTVTTESIAKLLEEEKLKKEPEAFMPPHHLVYKVQATNNILTPTFEPQSNIGIAGRLVVTAIRARDLHDTQAMGHQDPYIRFSMEGTSKQKKVVFPVPRCQGGGQNPVWNHTVEIPLSSEDIYLRVSVWNKNMMADSLIGRSRVPLKGVLPFINPIVAFWQGDHRERVWDSYERMFLTTSKYAKECGRYSLRSWFELVRDLKSSQSAGEILLEFRFIPYRASKIIDWNLYGGKKGGEIRRQPKIFGESLKVGLDSSEVTMPQPIFDCVEYLEEYALETEGLFRVPGDSKKIEGMKKRYNLRQQVTLKGDNEVAGLLKLYFRELPEPLIPYTHYKSLISVPSDASSEEDMIERFKVLLATMDQLTRNILRYLCELLSKIAAHSEVNMMAPKNLATCWAPSLMRAKNENDPSNIRNIPMTIDTTASLIQHCEKIFGVAKFKGEPQAMKDLSGRQSIMRLNHQMSPSNKSQRSKMKPAILAEIKEAGATPETRAEVLRKARERRSPSNSSLSNTSMSFRRHSRASRGSQLSESSHNTDHISLKDSLHKGARGVRLATARSQPAGEAKLPHSASVVDEIMHRARSKSHGSHGSTAPSVRARSRSRSPSRGTLKSTLGLGGGVTLSDLKGVKLSSLKSRKKKPPPPPPKSKKKDAVPKIIEE